MTAPTAPPRAGLTAVLARFDRLGADGGPMGVLRTLTPYLVASVLALAAALWTYQPWAFGTAIIRPDGDSLAFHAWVQNIVESGWYETGPRLAAPFAQNSHSYSVTDDLLFAIVGKVLVPLTGSVGAAVSWCVVLSFPAAAALGVGAARSLRTSRTSAALVGFAFALLPDHFLRTFGHFSLAQTWVVPLGVLAATSLVVRSPHRGRSRRLREVAILVGCASISLVNAYYAVFAGVLVAAAFLGAWRLRGFRHAVVPGALRVLALAVPIGVAILLDARSSPSPIGYASVDITRSAADADVYGGKILAMLLPPSAHRLELFRQIRHDYDSTFPFPGEGPALGTLATLGFLFLLVWAVLAYWRRPGTRRRPVLETLAGLMWAALLAYTVGGLGQLWAFALDGGGLRAWSRMHVFIALLALVAVGFLLDRLRRVLVRALVVGVLLVAVAFDQTSGVYRPDPGAAIAVETEVTGLTRQIEQQVPAGAMVYQYPDVTFPVADRDVAPASAYDGFLPYLYSSRNLHWSYGGLQGDPTSDWQTSLGGRPAPEQVAMLAGAGFAGVLVDTTALTADPEALAAMRAALGTPSVTSSSGRWEYYPLPAPAGVCSQATDALAEATLSPPLLYPGDGFEPRGRTYVSTEGGELRLLTLREGGWPRVDVEFSVDLPPGGAHVTWPDGRAEEVAGGAHDLRWSGELDGTEAEIAITLPPGGDGQVTVASTSSLPELDRAADACLAGTARPGAADPGSAP